MSRLARRATLVLAAAMVSLGVPTAVPVAHSAGNDIPTARETSSRGALCNVHSYNRQVRKVTGRRDVTLTRLSGKDYPGRTTVSRGTRYTSQFKIRARASVAAAGSAKIEVGGNATLKKVVGLFVKNEINAGANLRASIGGSYEKYSDIVVQETYTIPKAATVAWYSGWQSASGSAQVSRCDAQDGRGDGYVLWDNVRWSSYNPVNVMGGVRCDLRATNVVARAAQAEICNR